MATEKFINNAQTTLNGSISNSATTITVLSSTPFGGVTGNFRIVIDSEIMLVTNVSGVTLTVTRGQEGTPAAYHGDGSVVSHVWTAGSLNQSVADCCQEGLNGSLPAAEKAGRLYFATDTLILYRDNGSSWDKVIQQYSPVATAVDGATVTFDLSQGKEQLVVLGGSRTLALSNEPATGNFTILLKQPASGGPYTVTWWSGIKWASGVTPTLTTTASKYDVFVFIKLGSGSYLGTVAGQNF